MIAPRIEILCEKKLIGKCLQMSFVENKTFELWQSFMPRRNEIKNVIGTYLYSVQFYPHLFFTHFDAKELFTKWATREVTDFNDVPLDMEQCILPGGLYAVFIYKGLPSDAGATFQYIIRTWLPESIYELDNRPHFEILGEKFDKDSSNSEEEIWIPIKVKS